MKILFLSRWYPFPADNGAKLRVFALIKGLAQKHEVHFLSFCDSPETTKVEPIKQYCKSVRTIQWHEYVPGSIKALAGLFSLTPRSIVDTYSKEMDNAIKAALHHIGFDLVVVSQWQMASYSHLFGDTPVIFEELEVGVLYPADDHRSDLASLWRKFTWLKHQYYLRNIIKSRKYCTVVSEKEKRLLSSFLDSSNEIVVIPNGVDTNDFVEFPACTPVKNQIVFTGSFRYRPNFEAMDWFIREIFPHIKAQVPDTVLMITGDADGLSLPEVEGVHHLGYVPDIRPIVKSSYLSIVPLKTGGGTRLKILEAMALRTPVVSTTKGAEGLDLIDEHHILIADEAEMFANHVARLLKNCDLRNLLSENAYKYVHQTYDWKVIIPRFLKLVDLVASKTGGYGI